jgi:hypothetical protein
MVDMIDAFWRAAAYCLHPRVVLWSLLPLLISLALMAGLGWAYWEPALQQVRLAIDDWALTEVLLRWLDAMHASRMRAFVAPVVVVAMAAPVATVVVLLLVVTLVTPAMVRLVARRRFPGLDMGWGVAWWRAPLWLLACTVAAMLALLASVPLWFVPPLALLLPPLIWGWLVYQMLGYAVLAPVAGGWEIRFVLRLRRWPLLGMGLLCGLLATAPMLIWAVGGAAAIVFAPFVIGLVAWLNALTFVFACAWFAHFLLADLQRLRQARLRSLGAGAAVVNT